MNGVSRRFLFALVVLGVLSAVLRHIGGDELTPALDRAVELASFFGLLAAVLLFIQASRPGGAEQRPSREPMKTTVVRINAIAVVVTVGLTVLVGGLAGIDAELLKLFATGAFMLAKDIVQSDQAH